MVNTLGDDDDGMRTTTTTMTTTMADSNCMAVGNCNRPNGTSVNK